MKVCCCILVHVNAAIVWENDVTKAWRSSSNKKRAGLLIERFWFLGKLYVGLAQCLYHRYYFVRVQSTSTYRGYLNQVKSVEFGGKALRMQSNDIALLKLLSFYSEAFYSWKPHLDKLPKTVLSLQCIYYQRQIGFSLPRKLSTSSQSTDKMYRPPVKELRYTLQDQRYTLFLCFQPPFLLNSPFIKFSSTAQYILCNHGKIQQSYRRHGLICLTCVYRIEAGAVTATCWALLKQNTVKVVCHC